MGKARKYLLLLPLLVGACTYDYEADLPGDTTITVIEGTLSPGAESWISVSRAATFSSDYSSLVTGVTGYLECEDGSRIEGTSDTPDIMFDFIAPSNYILLDTRNLRTDKKYRLHLSVEGKEEFESDWLGVHSAPVIDRLSYTTTDNGIEFHLSAHSDDSPHFTVNVEEAWEYTSLATTRFEYIPLSSGSPDGGKVVYRDWNEHPTYRCWRRGSSRTITISAATHGESRFEDAFLYSIDRSDMRISVLYRLIVGVGTISSDAREYWDNLERISHISGDLFTPIPSNMEGNIHRTRGSGQVIGFIEVSSFASDTLFYKNDGLYRQSPTYTEMLNEWMHYHYNQDFPNDDSYNYYVPEKSLWDYAWNIGNVPIREAQSNGNPIEDMYIWGRKECVDCRVFGGSTGFPADWPDRRTIKLPKE